MIKLSITTTLIILLLHTLQLRANIDSLSDIEATSKHPVWLDLIHYIPDSNNESGYISEILDDSFFISPRGKSMPREELIESINAIKNNIRIQNSDFAQCLFPARTLWLVEQGLVSRADVDFSSCDDFNNWRRHGEIQSISVIFATGYLGNPASFYGHVLLKFNSSDNNSQTDLQNSTINFGAIVPDQENPVVYVIKGLLGGYDSSFSHINYYFHNHNYGEVELRDMWEYELALSKVEVEFIIAHLWEILGKRYTYYFLKENCAYRMAELFNIIPDLNLVPDNLIWTYPQAFIQQIASTQHHGRSLVKDIIRHPSRQRRFYDKYTELSGDEIDSVNHVVDDNRQLNSHNFDALKTQQQHRVLDTLLDYYQLIRDEEAGSKDAANISYQSVLSKRFQVEQGDSIFNSKLLPDSPDKGRPPSYVSVSYNQMESDVDYVHIKLRPAYYDSLDATTSHNAYSRLSMGEFGLSISDGKTDLDYLHIINIESLSHYATGLPGDQGNAWRLAVGLDRYTPDCNDCRTLRFQGDYGYTYNVSENAVFAAMIGAGIQETYLQNNNYFVRASLVHHNYLSSKWRYKIDIQYREDFIDNQIQHFFSELSIRYNLSDRYDIRFGIIDGSSTEYAVTVGYYW